MSRARGRPIIALALVCGGCERGAEVRFRVSYTVDDHGVSKTARAVWSKRVWAAAIPLVQEFNSEFHGEAVPLRLANGGILLLMPIGEQGDTGDVGTVIRNLFSHRAKAPDHKRVANTRDVSKMIGQSRRLRCRRYGTPQPSIEPGEFGTNDNCLDFVFVAKPSELRTLRRVPVEDGHLIGLNGVRLRDVRITITDEPVTRGLERLLPWSPQAQAYWRVRLSDNEDRDKRFANEFIYIRN